MIEILGYFCTTMTLLGFFLNARMSMWGFYCWIIGDIGWIVYSILTNTFPHAFQCTFIIGLNIYGIIKWKRAKQDETKKEAN